jgi:hypothetical protein
LRLRLRELFQKRLSKITQPCRITLICAYQGNWNLWIVDPEIRLCEFKVLPYRSRTKSLEFLELLVTDVRHWSCHPLSVLVPVSASASVPVLVPVSLVPWFPS